MLKKMHNQKFRDENISYGTFLQNSKTTLNKIWVSRLIFNRNISVNLYSRIENITAHSSLAVALAQPLKRGYHGTPCQLDMASGFFCDNTLFVRM